MMKFRKKPVVIEAEQWYKGEDIDGVCTKLDTGILHYLGGVDEPHIHTLEGVHQVSEGDWIIKGVQGELYACKPDIFEMTYEPAKE